MGRATALALAREGWRVAVVGRRVEALEETVRLADVGVERFLVCPCDIGRREAVDAMARNIHAAFGDVEVLVNAAGTNVPRRSLETLSAEDYHAMIETNLNGAYYCVRAFLPGMRARRSGTIVNIISDAGKLANAKAGPGYVMSKFGLAGLNQSINAEERGNGVRACGIFPGDIDTPLLERRPSPPSAEARGRMMSAEDIAACAMLCIQLPPRTIIEEILVRPP